MKFKPVFIEGTTIDDTWHRLLWELWEKGREYKITKGSFEGDYRKAFDYVSGVIHYPHTRPLSPQMPEGCSMPPPTTDESIEQYFSEYIMSDTIPKNTHYTYGAYINGNPKVCKLDQLNWICNHFLKVGTGTEHCVISIGNGEELSNYDVPYNNESERRTTACLRLLDFRIIDGCLTTGIYYRSWDIIAFPENIGAFTLLNEFVAQEIGVEPGPLTFASKSLHSYSHAFEYIKNRLGK